MRRSPVPQAMSALVVEYSTVQSSTVQHSAAQHMIYHTIPRKQNKGV